MVKIPYQQRRLDHAPSYQGRYHKNPHIDFHGHIPKEIWDSGLAAIAEIGNETLYVTGSSKPELTHALKVLGYLYQQEPKLLKRFHGIHQVKAVPVFDLLVQGRNEEVGLIKSNYDFERRLAEYTKVAYPDQ